jgi:hypothetical protein
VWTLIQRLQQDSGALDTFTWKNDSLWYKAHLYLCKNPQLKKKVLLELHTSPVGGHSGFLKTYHRVNVTHPLRKNQNFTLLWRDRIPKFLRGLAHDRSSLILLHVIIVYDHKPYQMELSAVVFQDSFVRTLPDSLSFEMPKPKMGLTSSLAPLFPYSVRPPS